MGDPPTSSDSTDLCKSCGLCCNGVLLDYVPIEEREVDRLSGFGLALHRARDGSPRFDLPCPKFRDSCCTIYGERPASCRAFRCELLKTMEAGQVTLAEAKARVAEAKMLVDRIWPLLRERTGGAAGLQWFTLLKEWKSRPMAERSTGADARLVLDLTALNRLLDTHFREPARRHVSENG